VQGGVCWYPYTCIFKGGGRTVVVPLTVLVCPVQDRHRVVFTGVLVVRSSGSRLTVVLCTTSSTWLIKLVRDRCKVMVFVGTLLVKGNGSRASTILNSTCLSSTRQAQVVVFTGALVVVQL